MSTGLFSRLLSFPGWTFRKSTDRQLKEIRLAMLTLLDGHEGPEVERLVQRVRFADGLETLWYLRQDVLMALSESDGELAAQQHMQQLNRLFKGGLPQTMGPRAHHRFTV